MAVQEHKVALSGWNLEHVALDDGDGETGEWSRTTEESNALAAADDPATVAYIGPYNSGAAMVSMPVLNRTGLLQVLPNATWPGLTQSGWGAGEPERYYPTGKQTLVRMMPADSDLAQMAAERVHALGASTAWTVGDDSDYSRGMTKVFAGAAYAHSVQVTRNIELSGLDLTGTGGPTHPQPDAIFSAPSNLDGVKKLAAALKQNTLRSGVFVTDVALSDQLSEGDRQLMEGWHILFNAGVGITQSPAYLEFARRFHERYGRAPSAFAANAYDATGLVLDAAGKPGMDRRGIIAAVLNTQKPDGASGPIRFTDGGDIVGRRVSSYKMVGGQLILEEKVAVP